MYEVKTLLPQFDINLPTCMYTVKNVGLEVDACGGSTAADGNAPADVSSIQNRQEKVFQQINELKEQLDSIRKNLSNTCLKPSAQKEKHTQTVERGNNGGLREEPLYDVVINGHPNFIPYALLALKNAWKDLFTIDVKVYTHSTMTDIGDEARAFEKSLYDIKVNENLPKINITLIWKNCEHTEMISSPTMYVPIYGEINIIRYLARVGPEEYRYENSRKCTHIDATLDICYQLLRCTTSKSRARMINALCKRLSRQKFFAGDQISIADIAVHSSLRRMHDIHEKELNALLKAWRERVRPVTLL